MAICPDHGGYTGDACRKCQEPTVLTGTVKFTSPDIDRDDQLALLRLERAITVAQQQAQAAQMQFQNFAKVMFEKYGVKAAEYQLDMEKMEFVTRPI